MSPEDVLARVELFLDLPDMGIDRSTAMSAVERAIRAGYGEYAAQRACNDISILRDGPGSERPLPFPWLR